MKFDAFIGGSYESRAFTADQEQTVNWFVENLQSKGATSPRILLPTPGVEIITTITADSPGRAHYSINGREFAVIGGAFYEFGLDGTVLNSSANDLQGPLATPTLINTSLPATISCNGDGGGQLFITAGGNGYIYDLTTSPASTVPVMVNALEGKAHFGGHLDGYFLALDTDTSTLYVSELYDGATWNTGTMFAQRSLGPDKWKSMKVSGRAVWLFGEQTTEVWYNTGDRFPLSPLANQVIGHGIAAPWSAETLGNDVIWVSSSMDGKVCILRASGMAPEPISTFPLETKMQSYLSLTNAVADAYSDSGHSFYMINFDNDHATHCWDKASGMWHQRGTWLPEENRFTRWRPRFYSYAFNQHRMLDASNGNLYRISDDLVRDVDGRLIRRLRRAPAISNENKRVFYSEFELDLEPGVGVDQSMVAFVMHATITTVGGTVTDQGDEPVGGATITITVDGDDIAETTTDEDGEYEIEGIPDGDVVVTVSATDGDGNPLCGSASGVAAGPGPGQFLTGPSFLPLNIQVGPCAFDVSYTVDINGEGPESTSAYGGGNGLITLTPTVSGGTGPYTYHWRVWDEHTSYLGYRYASTDEISTEDVSILGAQGICFGQVRLTVTDATMTVVSVGPETSDWRWDCI